MVDGSNGSKPGGIKQRGKILVAVSAVLLFAVLVVALTLSSPGKAPEGGNEHENENKGDVNTSDEVEEDKLVSGVASDYILHGSDMGAEWIASDIATGLDLGPMNASIISSASITFKHYNSTGQLEYVVEITVGVFDSISNASAYYNKSIEIHPEDDSYLPPEYRPSYTVIIANVSIGDGGVILDLPRITLGHEAKALGFIDRNVLCGITYHHATSIDPLPNELLIDLANKVEAKIV